jgi:hypothetical protein
MYETMYNVYCKTHRIWWKNLKEKHYFKDLGGG